MPHIIVLPGEGVQDGVGTLLMTFEHRGAEMQLDRLPRLVDELVTSKKVDVIVAFGYLGARR